MCTATWEVADGDVHQYEGGYAAYVLARAERDRQAAAREDRRQQLLRKELAWLRRGPPARTSKPKFRIEAANALIADEPEPRDRVELLRFATARLGDKVLDAERRRRSRFGDRRVLRDVDLAARARATASRSSASTARARRRSSTSSRASATPTPGTVDRGATVRLAHLSPGHRRDPRAPARARGARGDPRRATGSATAREITAGAARATASASAASRARTLVRDLSGGERRRLQLMRLLMGEPNVLLLDEPTNDLDIDTLTALEDLLDGWPGTLVVVSHDRYFVERVCDDVHALDGDGGIRHLPGGIEQYLELRARRPRRRRGAPAAADARDGAAGRRARCVRAARKEVARLERALDRLGDARGARCTRRWPARRPTTCRLRELNAELRALAAERDDARGGVARDGRGARGVTARVRDRARRCRSRRLPFV